MAGETQTAEKIQKLEDWLRTNQKWLVPVGLLSLVLLLRPPKGKDEDGGGAEPPPPPGRKAAVLLDPGHGGTDLGHRMPLFYAEKKINLDFAQLIREYLVAGGVSTRSTRNLAQGADSTVSLQQRQATMADVNPQAFVSLHIGRLPDIFNPPRGTIGVVNAIGESERLAEILVNSVAPVVGCGNRGVVTYADYLDFPHHEILRATGAVPSVILEIAALDDPCFQGKYGQARWLAPDASNNWRHLIARAIAEGLLDFLGLGPVW